MILGEDFIFRDDMKEDTVPIEIKVEPYSGVVLRYTQVGVKENPGKDTATLQFQYELYKMGDFTETQLRKDKRFEDVAGLILNTLILEAKAGKPNDRTYNSKELIEE